MNCSRKIRGQGGWFLLHVLGLGLLLSLLSSCSRPDPQTDRFLTVIYANDINGQLSPCG